MNKPSRTNQKLLEEIASLKQRIQELEQSEAEHEPAGRDPWEGNQRFRSLMEATNDWIWEIDNNGCYTYVSPKTRDLLGYDREDIIGKTPFDFMPANEAERGASFLAEIVRSRQPFSGVENTNLHKDGRSIRNERGTHY